MSEHLKITENEAERPPVLWQFATHAVSEPQCLELKENLLGMVESGTKVVHYAGEKYRIGDKELFLLSPGKHYVENIPSRNGPYKETCLSFDNQAMAGALSALVTLYGIELEHPEGGGGAQAGGPTLNHVNARVWPEMRLFFDSLVPYMDTDYLTFHPELMRLKLAEFAYMVIDHKEYGLQYKLLRCVERIADPFESIVRSSIFENLSINELALRTNKSLTSFKNDFQRIFGMTPHRWILKQRLLHARLEVVSTTKSISQIGYECKFDNTSHFIKLFKREFNITPLSLRQEYRQGGTVDE